MSAEAVRSLQEIIAIGALIAAAYLLVRHGPRAIVWLAPASVEVGMEAPADKMKLPLELQAFEKALVGLGFAALGSHYEKPRLARETLSYDYANAHDRTFATLYLDRFDQPRLYFISETAGGAVVITANFRRPAREVPGRYLSAGMEDMPADRLYKAHLRRAAQLGDSKPAATIDERLAVARAWFKGVGRSDLRHLYALPLLYSLFALGMVGAAILRLALGPK